MVYTSTEGTAGVERGRLRLSGGRHPSRYTSGLGCCAPYGRYNSDLVVNLFRRRRATFERETIRIAQEVLGEEVPVEPLPQLDAIAFDTVQLNLSGLRERYRDLDPLDADSWLQSALSELLVAEGSPGAAGVTQDVLPGLRSRSFVEAHRLVALHRNTPLEPMAVRSVTESVFVGLLWDRTHSMLSLSESLLRQWDRSYDEVLAIALANLTSKPIVGWVGTDDRIFRLVGGDDYVSARMLDGDVLARLPFTGDIVVCAPTRTDLFAVAADDPRALNEVFEASLEASREGVAVSLRPLRLSDGEWTELRLDPEHPAYVGWRRLTRLDWANEAGATRSLLQDLVGSAIFVGSLIVREDETTGITETVSVWSEGVPTLLAAADLVAFPRSDRDAAFVTAPWVRVVDVMSDRMARTDHYPERWLVESFPTNDQLDALSA